MSSVIHTDAKLEYTPEVAAATAELYERVRAVVPEVEWPVHAPYVDAIERLKAAVDQFGAA